MDRAFGSVRESAQMMEGYRMLLGNAAKTGSLLLFGVLERLVRAGQTAVQYHVFGGLGYVGTNSAEEMLKSSSGS